MVRRKFVEKEGKMRLLEDVDQLYCEVLGWCEKVGNPNWAEIRMGYHYSSVLGLV